MTCLWSLTALASGLGEEVGGVETLSSYYMANEVAAVEEGMAIAVPSSVWERFVEMTVDEFAAGCREVASGIDWRPYHGDPRAAGAPSDREAQRPAGLIDLRLKS